jgi:hypothetical protein
VLQPGPAANREDDVVIAAEACGFGPAASA